MNRIIKYFGKRGELEKRLYSVTQNPEKYLIVSSHLDNLVEFVDVSDEEFFTFCDALGDEVYTEGNEKLEKVLVEFLLENGLTLSVAESCTGGMISSKIVDVPGASRVFYEGVVTYSNGAKIERLSVPEETLRTYGAVSEETAKDMAYGLLNENVDIAVSTTGIAGPDGGTDEKPVGLVYIGIAYKNADVLAYKCNFSGKRNEIRSSATNAALYLCYNYLQKNL